MARLRVILPAILVIQAVAVFSSDYLSTDDWFLVAYGREARDVESLFSRKTKGSPAIRPLALAATRVESVFFGDAAAPRLLVNVALHGAACFLLLATLLGAGADERTASLAVLLFAVHPLHAEALAWYHSGHTSIPVAVLVLATLAGHLCRWRPLAVALCFVLALLTRENAIMALPVAFWISRRRTLSMREAFVEVRPLFIAGGLWLAVRVWQVAGALLSDDAAYLPVGQSPLLALCYVLFHLTVPVHPGIGFATPWAVGAVGLSLFALVSARRDMVAPVIWIALVVLPFILIYDTSDPLFSSEQSGYERRWYHLYLPAVGLARILAQALANRPRLAAVAVLLLLVLHVQNARWWATLGEGARDARETLASLVATGRPLVFEFEKAPDALSEVVEHEVLALQKIFPAATAPVFRKKPAEDSYVRASHDRFGYPGWVQVPRPDLIPDDALRVRWTAGRLRPGP